MQPGLASVAVQSEVLSGSLLILCSKWSGAQGAPGLVGPAGGPVALLLPPSRPPERAADGSPPDLPRQTSWKQPIRAQQAQIKGGAGPHQLSWWAGLTLTQVWSLAQQGGVIGDKAWLGGSVSSWVGPKRLCGERLGWVGRPVCPHLGP